VRRSGGGAAGIALERTRVAAGGDRRTGFGATSLAVRAIDLPWHAVVPALLAQPATDLVLAFWTLGLIGYSGAQELSSLAQVTAVMPR
jgi:hypothetical protein